MLGPAVPVVGAYWYSRSAVAVESVGVQALRRTLKDILTFVPFIIILIIPMTPLGHVLVFGFIQRYFPDFFPSQFNQRRQEMVKTYEDLRQRLQLAQAAANHEEVWLTLLEWLRFEKQNCLE